MGRVVSEDALWDSSRQALVARAVAERCGALGVEELASRLQALSNLLPGLRGRLLALRVDLLVELVRDVPGVAQKLLQLRAWFPSADLERLLSRRPSLLSAEEFARVPAARTHLLARFGGNPQPSLDPTNVWGGGGGGGADSGGSGGGSSSGSSGGGGGGGRGLDASMQGSAVVDDLVTRQPLLLVENVEALLAELGRLLPGMDAAAALLANPDLADSVASNRALSLWLMPCRDVAGVLAANPDIVLSLQRGVRSLGPGAEFLDTS